MKALASFLPIILVGLFLSACGGPSKAELRSELQQIEAEMMQLEMMAYDARSRMSQAEWQNFFGGFAAGFGAVSGDGNMTLAGGNAIAGASGDYNRASFNFQQIQARYNQLAPRRIEILQQLH